MTGPSHTSAQSGRELSRARRRAMSSTGAAVLAGGAAQRPPAARQAIAATVEKSDKPLSGQALSRARRAMLSKGGKSALGKNILTAPAASSAAMAAKSDAVPSRQDSAVAGQAEPCDACAAASSVVPRAEASDKPLSGQALSRARRAMLSKGGKSALTAPAATAQPQQSFAVAEKAEPCCEACADPDSDEPCAADVAAAEAAASEVGSEALDSLCDIIDSNPSSSTAAASSVRAYCRDRRNRLSRQGKLGLPGKAGSQAHKTLLRHASGSSLSGKVLAKLQREDRSRYGRGDASASRPSGRVRPAKVEVGTTLAGQAVTGTQVEQTEKITGVESGTCREVTGTEYLGVEQFAKFCTSTPAPAAAKVSLSETSSGQLLTGSSTASSEKVSGNEAGSCKSITGSQYLGGEHFEAFCGSRGGNVSQDKVVAGRTGKNMRITGVDEARDNAVTGSESGSSQYVTGTDYVNAGQKKTLAEAPAKVGFSHTAAGVSVSGGESSRVSGVTGDTQDVCRRVTGTEYISSERFQSVCGTQPEMPVAKVGVDISRGGMTVTGNLVDRNGKVTGNEPGSCQRVTGDQYAETQPGLCDKRATKVHQMHTLKGGSLTGTEATPSPKLTGDARGRCADVTGNEYVSQEYFQQSCPQTPVPSNKRTGMSHTWNRQLVSGVQMGHSQKTTGAEHGICKAVTGSTYAAREQVNEFCSASAVAQGEQRLTQHPGVPSMPPSGIGPGPDERLAGNFQRGVCQNVSGTPYQGRQDAPSCSAVPQTAQQAGGMHHLAQAPINQALPVAHTGVEAEPYRAGFSVVSPARAAWQHRTNPAVHRSVYAVGGGITGVVNKAEGVVSGTPEFRHQQLEPNAVATPVTSPDVVQRGAITGEGSEAGTRITGDDWSRGGSVTGTEGMFAAKRNQTQRGAPVERNNIGAHALKDRDRPEVSVSRVTGGSGNTRSSAAVTLSGGAGA